MAKHDDKRGHLKLGGVDVIDVYEQKFNSSVPSLTDGTYGGTITSTTYTIPKIVVGSNGQISSISNSTHTIGHCSYCVYCAYCTYQHCTKCPNNNNYQTTREYGDGC